MKVRPIILIPLVIAGLIAVLFTIILVQQIQRSDDPTRDLGRPSVLLGQMVPSFNAPLLSRPEQRVNQKFILGEVAVVNFWGTWCRECYLEHDYLMQLAENVPVYGVNFNDERATALAWLQKNGNPFVASYFDPNGEIYIKWGVTGAPETFVIDANGIIRYRHAGRLTEAVLQQKIMPMIVKLENEPRNDKRVAE